MSITLGSNTLNYKTNEKKYITTFSSEYNIAVDAYLDNIFNAIFPFYDSRQMQHSNVCGANAEFICKNLKIDGISLGKIIIVNWIEENPENLKEITKFYGDNSLTIRASYHALAYLELTIEDIKYYVAIETTICDPYKLQFYVGTNEGEFENIIKTRYQCSDFKVSFDCVKSWDGIAYNRGGKPKQKHKKGKSRKTNKCRKRNKTRKSKRTK